MRRRHPSRSKQMRMEYNEEALHQYCFNNLGHSEWNYTVEYRNDTAQMIMDDLYWNFTNNKEALRSLNDWAGIDWEAYKI